MQQHICHMCYYHKNCQLFVESVLLLKKMIFMHAWGLCADNELCYQYICFENNFISGIANILQLETLPACQIWQKNMPPFSWTASTIGFHASTCSFVQMPGTLLYLAMHIYTNTVVLFRTTLSCDNEIVEICILQLHEDKKGYHKRTLELYLKLQ